MQRRSCRPRPPSTRHSSRPRCVDACRRYVIVTAAQIELEERVTALNSRNQELLEQLKFLRGMLEQSSHAPQLGIVPDEPEFNTASVVNCMH